MMRRMTLRRITMRNKNGVRVEEMGKWANETETM